MIFISLSPPAIAKPKDDAVKSALEFCRTIPADIESARKTLRENGWESSEDSTMNVLVNGSITFNFRSDDLEYTFRNAFFMAASVLGNSSLGGDQISMKSDDFELAVLGINEGTPYCMMSGPSRLMELLDETREFTVLMLQSSNVLQQAMGLYSNNKIAIIGRFDTEKRNDLLATFGLPDEELIKLKSALAPVTLHITASEIVQ